MPSTGIYRALMEEIENRREAVNISMSTVCEISGVSDGYYPKMLSPDTPSGRQARWEQVHDVVEALFGKNFTVQIIPDEGENGRLHSAPRIDQNSSANARKIRHWRHRKHFVELGRLGGVKRAKLPKRKLTAIARKANKVRWKRIRDAKRHGEAHNKTNSEKQSTTAVPTPSTANKGQRE